MRIAWNTVLRKVFANFVPSWLKATLNAYRQTKTKNPGNLRYRDCMD